MTEAAAGRDDSAVHAERRGAAGFILLDRPRALNALTLPMVRAIAAALDGFERDPRVARVVVASAASMPAATAAIAAMPSTSCKAPLAA